MATGSDDVREAMIREAHPRQLEAEDVAFLLARLAAARAEAAVTALALRNTLRSPAHLRCICDDCANARRLLGEGET